MPTPIGALGNLSATATVDNFHRLVDGLTAAIAFMPLELRPGYLGCVAQEWMTRRARVGA